MYMDSILENRKKKSRMTNTTREELIKKTEKNLLTLRKNQIDEYIMSKRIVTNSDQSTYQINPLNLYIPENLIIDIPVYLNNFDYNFLENYIFSEDINLMKYGLYILRKYISSDLSEGKIKTLVKENLINTLIKLLIFPDISVQFEASWILINITNYNDQAIDIISNENSLKITVDFFKYADENLNEHAIWLIGNLAADRQYNREFLITNGILEKLKTILEDIGTSEHTKEKIIWSICNLCRGKIYDYSCEFVELVPILLRMLEYSGKLKETSQLVFIIFKLTSTANLILNKFINQETYQILVKIMNQFDLSIKMYCVKIIANLVSGSDIQTQVLINAGIIDLYKHLLYQEEETKVLKEIIWGVSNILAGTCSQIQKILDSGIVDKIFGFVEFLSTRVNEDKIYYEALRECAFCLTNIITGGLNQNKIYLLQNSHSNLMQILNNFLNVFYNEKKLMEFILLSIKSYLILEEEELPLNDDNYFIRNTLLSLGLEDFLKELLNYPHQGVQDRAIEVLDILDEMEKMDINI